MGGQGTPEPTLHELLRDAQARLERAGIEAPRLQAQALLGHATGRGRAALLADLREPVPAAAAERFEALLARRLAHEPLQYLLGRAGFLDFELAVGPGIFIPRPETEGLVERALAEWDPASTSAIDLCTGSGAIAIALARARPGARIVAVDLSARALEVARANAATLGVADRISFVRADLLSALRAPLEVGLLACNPPYAPRDEVVQPEVRDHEPEMAWSGGPRGTEIYERLVAEAAALLPVGTPLVLELGYGQESSVPALLLADGRWSTPTLESDFQGIPRVLTARRAQTGVGAHH